MPEESLTPEERLLRLIRRKGGSSSRAAETAKAPPATTSKPFQPFRKIPRLSSLFALRKKGASPKEIPFLLYDPMGSSPLFLQVERLLISLVGLTFLFLLGSRFLPHRPMAVSALLEKASLPREPSTKEQTAPKPYDHYGKVIGHRDLFQPGLPSKEVKGTGPSAIESRFKDLALIGIISGKTPQVIIEDKKENKTYFLKEGELVGELRVEQILDEKVTLSYEGEQFDLVL